MAPLDTAFAAAAEWPVDHFGVAVVFPSGEMQSAGDIDRDYRIASVSKLLTAWACLIACEEGIVSLDDAVGQSGCTLGHLLAHAGGYAFEGSEPISAPGRKRGYSNTGYELAAQHVVDAAGVSFARYLRESVFEPLSMANTMLAGSPAKDVHSTIRDLSKFAAELLSPTMISRESWLLFATPQFPDLDGVVPGVGTFRPCPWGMGAEIRGQKHPHWMGNRNSAATYGHFGGSGTFLWVDPVANVAAVALTSREFDDWAMSFWPVFSDAVITAVRG